MLSGFISVFHSTSVFCDLVYALAVQGRHPDVRKGLQIGIKKLVLECRDKLQSGPYKLFYVDYAEKFP